MSARQNAASHGDSKPRLDGVSEIEVTPAMISAGVDAFASNSPSWDIDGDHLPRILTAVFIAMLKSRRNGRSEPSEVADGHIAENPAMKILPCPFCGREPYISGSGEGQRGLMIECMTPGCVSPHVSFYEHAAAVAAWNRRNGSQEK